MKINTNHSNIEFEKEILKVKLWLDNKVLGICGYSTETVLERLMQYLVMVSLPVYAKMVHGLSKNKSISFPVNGTILDVGVAKIELGSGKLKITFWQWLKGLSRFLVHWSICLFAVIFVRNSMNGFSKFTLVYGVAEDAIVVDDSDEQFINYCQKGPVSPLNTKSAVYIQFDSESKPNSHHNYHYCKRPLLDVLRDLKLGINSRIQLLVRHLILFVTYLISIIRMPQATLLGREFAYSGVIKELDRCEKIESILLTCSSYQEQQIWLRELINTNVHMVWYSQSLKPVVYCNNKLESYVPNIPWIRVGIHWVWTSEFSDYLTSLGLSSTFEVVGAIVWYLPKLKELLDSSIKITIFDVSPFSDDVALECGHVTNYHHPDNLFAFINDILFVKNAIEDSHKVTVNLHLKTKRGYKAAYDKDYFSYLDKLSTSGVVSLENHSENMYSLISSSNLVIAYPFSSPNYIADELNIRSIHYDPTESICEHNFGGINSLIHFANNCESFHKEIISAIQDDIKK